jgi:hypothetical protein
MIGCNVAYDALMTRKDHVQARAHEFPDKLDSLKLWVDFCGPLLKLDSAFPGISYLEKNFQKNLMMLESHLT